ncbi:MAG: RidA family protein [Planctomycetota bacterium]
MEDRQIVATADAPAAIGPYSQAVVHGGLVYCSGQIAIDPATGEIVAGGVEAQTHQVLDNLVHVLEAAGTSLARALKTTVYLVDMNEYPKMNAVYGSYFAGGAPPARATVQVTRLPKDARVEIDCIAAAGD